MGTRRAWAARTSRLFNLALSWTFWSLFRSTLVRTASLSTRTRCFLRFLLRALLVVDGAASVIDVISEPASAGGLSALLAPGPLACELLGGDLPGIFLFRFLGHERCSLKFELITNAHTMRACRIAIPLHHGCR